MPKNWSTSNGGKVGVLFPVWAFSSTGTNRSSNSVSLIFTHTNSPAARGALRTIYCLPSLEGSYAASQQKSDLCTYFPGTAPAAPNKVWLRAQDQSLQVRESTYTALSWMLLQLSLVAPEPGGGQGQALSYIEHVQVKSACMLGMCINPSTAGQF